MRIPFTTRQEIFDYDACYIEGQSEKRQIVERAVIGLKENVQSRGYLRKAELRQMAHWKDHRLPQLIDQNLPGVIEKITAEVFLLIDDWEKLEKLTTLHGVRESVASVILHLYDAGDYPILDVHALRAIGIDANHVDYNELFWRQYVNFCRKTAKCYKVSMRTLDRALYTYGKT